METSPLNASSQRQQESHNREHKMCNLLKKKYNQPTMGDHSSFALASQITETSCTEGGRYPADIIWSSQALGRKLVAKSSPVSGRGHLSRGAWQLLNPAASRGVLQMRTGRERERHVLGTCWLLRWRSHFFTWSHFFTKSCTERMLLTTNATGRILRLRADLQTPFIQHHKGKESNPKAFPSE